MVLPREVRQPFPPKLRQKTEPGQLPSPWRAVTETELIQLVLAGDPVAERALYDGHVDRVWGMVYRFAGDPDRAADWTQETFVKVFERLRDFRGESSARNVDRVHSDLGRAHRAQANHEARSP